MGREYAAADGILNLVYKLNNGAHSGTGVQKITVIAKNLLGPIPEVLVTRAVGDLNNLFGDYPQRKDVAPSAVFTACFFIISILHLTLFVVNCSRGHLFYISLAWSVIAMAKMVGFALRTCWATDVLQVGVGIASEVLLILSGICLITVNLVLAQRLFTWRHPVGGDRDLFKNIMYFLYVQVIMVVILTVFSSAVPYVYFLSKKSDWAYKICIMVSAVLIILYSLTAVSLLGLSYFFQPTTKDENLYTYQPWWIESFHPFYFVKKNAAREAEETFMKRNHNHRHAVRVIAATHHHYNVVEGLTNERGSLEHNKSILIVTATTVLTLLEAILRAVACFQPRPQYTQSPVTRPIVAYICWGVLEVLVNLLYLVGRVDLRFYKPDILPRKVRNIITAEQSFFHSRAQSRMASQNPSDLESEVDDEDYDFGDTELSAGVPPEYHKEDKLEKYDESTDNESDFVF